MTFASIFPSASTTGRSRSALATGFLLCLVTLVAAATNPDPCPSDENCSDWVLTTIPNLTSTYQSGPYTVCPSTSTASWTIAQGTSGGRRTFTVPGRDECTKTKNFGLTNFNWTWTITGPTGFTPQTGGTTTATLNNQSPIPGSYRIEWVGTADYDDTCFEGTVQTTYPWTFTIAAPQGTAAADPAEQTVCLNPEQSDLLGDGTYITKTITFTFTPTADGCSHNISWQLSGGDGLGLQAPLSGTGMTATATLQIPLNSPDIERTVRCDFASDDTGQSLTFATATVKVENPVFTPVAPILKVNPVPPTTPRIESCLAFSGDLVTGAEAINGSEDMVCPDGTVISSDPITLVSLVQVWSGAGGIGFGGSRHVVLNNPGSFTVTCRVVAIFVKANGALIVRNRTLQWRIRVNDVRLLLRPKLLWRTNSSLNPNPAAPGSLVQVTLGTAESIPGKKICRPNPTAPIAVSPAQVHFELPTNLDPVNPELTIKDGAILVGSNAKGSYPIKIVATAHILDAADVALCGGDLEPIERTVTLTVPRPSARVNIDDGNAMSGEVATSKWSIKNTGSVRESFSFSFTVDPPYSAGNHNVPTAKMSIMSAAALAIPIEQDPLGLEVKGWYYEVVGLADSSHDEPGRFGTVTLDPGQTARGVVGVQIHGGKDGDRGTIDLAAVARGEDVDRDQAEVGVGGWSAALFVNDVYLSKPGAAGQNVTRGELKVKWTGLGAKRGRSPVTFSLSVDRPGLIEVSFNKKSLKIQQLVPGVQMEGDQNIDIYVTAPDLNPLETPVKVTLTAEFTTPDPQAPKSPRWDFLVGKSGQNELTMKLSETPYVFVGEVGVLEVDARGGLAPNRDVTVSADQALISSDPTGPWESRVKQVSVIGNSKSFKLYYKYSPTTDHQSPLPTAADAIHFTSSWQGTEKPVDQKVWNFDIGVTPSAVIAKKGKSAVAALVLQQGQAKREGVQWSIRPKVPSTSPLGVSIEAGSGNIQILQDAAGSAGGYEVTGTLVKQDPVPSVPSLTKNFDVVWVELGDEPRNSGIYPSDLAVVMRTGSHKEFTLVNHGSKTLRLISDREDVRIVRGETLAGGSGTLVEIHHSGTTGKEGDPYTRLRVVFEDDHSVEALQIRLYVFDLLQIKIQPVVLKGVNGNVYSDAYKYWLQYGASASAIWEAQSVLSFAFEAPTFELDPQSVYETITMYKQPNVNDEGVKLWNLFRGKYPHRITAFFTSIIEMGSDDPHGVGVIGEPAIFFGPYAGTVNSDKVIAHEMGHTFGLVHEGHANMDLMTVVGPTRITLADTLSSRPQVIKYLGAP